MLIRQPLSDRLIYDAAFDVRGNITYGGIILAYECDECYARFNFRDVHPDSTECPYCEERKLLARESGGFRRIKP